jgi:vacuolar-type H+-ATPase subunit C/Vma6
MNLLSGGEAAVHYGYSSARVKAMESRFMTRRAMSEIANARDVSSMMAILFQGDYREDLERFGGLAIKQELIDFALSRNLARNTGKLVQISPSSDKKTVRGVVGRWDLNNVKLALGAKDRGLGYESIASYVIDYGRYNAAAIKEAMREDSVETMLNRFAINSPYARILRGAADALKKSGSVAEAMAEIDRSYYKDLGGMVLGLRAVHSESALVLKMEIDVRNLLLLVKAKRAGMKFADVSGHIIGNGRMRPGELEQMYNGAGDVEGFVAQIKAYDMKPALDAYRNSRRKQLLLFEIGMRNAVFNESMRMLRHSILSFGTILAYAYMKEIEIFTLRILIHSRAYGLTKEETERLIVWKNE